MYGIFTYIWPKCMVNVGKDEGYTFIPRQNKIDLFHDRVGFFSL